MSFQPITFTYTPPKTVQTPAGAAASASTAGQSLTPQTRAEASRAAALLNRMAAVEDTNAYLTEALKAYAVGTSIRLRFAGDPELAPALQRLYGSVPATVTAGMYYHLVQLEAGMARTDMVLAGSGSTLEPSPYQRADVLRVTATVEAALCDTSHFRDQVPLLLREREEDSLVYDSLTSMLQSYPVLQGSSYAPAATSATPLSLNYTNPQSASPFDDFQALGHSLGSLAAQGTLVSVDQAQTGTYLQIDVSNQLAQSISGFLDGQERIYGATLNLLTATDQTILNTTDMIEKLLTDTVDAVLVLQSMFLTLKAMVFKTTLTDLKNAVTNFLLARAVAEVTLFTGVLDRLIQRAASPVENFLKQVSTDLTKISHDLSYLATLVSPDGLTTAVSHRIHGTNQQPKPLTFPSLDSVSQSVKEAAGYVAWGQAETLKKANLLRDSMTQALARKQQAAGTRLDFLAQLQKIDTNVTFFKNLILQIQQVARRNPAAPLQAALSPDQWASQPSATFGSSGQGTSGQLTLPKPSSIVAAVLTRGGATSIPA